MEKKSKNEDDELGSGTSKKVLTESEFQKMVDNDLRSCRMFIDAVGSDPATRRALCEFLYGRYLNQVHKSELEAQLKFEA